MKLKKNDLIEHVYSSLSYEFKKEDIKIACDEIFAAVSSALKDDNRVEIRNFGSFSTRKRITPIDPRSNPRDNKVTECNTVYYRMSKNLINRFNGS